MDKKRIDFPVKALWLPLLLGVAILSGCSEDADKVLAANVVATNASEVLPVEYTENVHVTDDRELTVVGDAVTDEKGTLTLEAINTEPIRKSIGPLTLTVRESKLMHFRPTYNLLDFYRGYTHEPEFNLIKLTVEVTNHFDEPLEFKPAETVLTSGGELKTLEDDVYLEELNGSIAAGETKLGSLGFVVENVGFESLAISTSDLLDQQGELIIPGEIISIDFVAR